MQYATSFNALHLILAQMPHTPLGLEATVPLAPTARGQQSASTLVGAAPHAVPCL